jgi:hypothetical protein
MMEKRGKMGREKRGGRWANEGDYFTEFALVGMGFDIQ